VQDRLREWVPSVRERLELFSCIAIRMLDIDGFRFDKAIQVTVDASGNFSAAMRKCAVGVGKTNFFLPGEITGGNNMGAVYLGRGRQPNHWVDDLKTAVSLTNASDSKWFLREPDQGALDAAAFHYSIYRFMTRFLGMDGNLEAGFDLPSNWVDAWNQMLLSNDFVNPNTGVLDPRHMYGTTNQDVFRWPGIRQGVDRLLLGQMITTLLLPGIPLLLWGEEQAFYVLDNTADNYIFGRQAMSPSPAWYIHGCYAGSSTQYFKMPLESAREGCRDIKNSWDHRDPAAPVRSILKAMYHLREEFPVIKDGLFLETLANQTQLVRYPGSNNTATETGLWSVRRAGFPGVQDLGDTPDIWFVYHNHNETTEYTFDCTNNSTALIAPFETGMTVKNLLFPHDEMTLVDGPKKLFINGSQKLNGCSRKVELKPFEFRVYVPKNRFVPPPPMITRFLPGHDTPILSTGTETSVNISFHFSAAMSCDFVTRSIAINSSTEIGRAPKIENVQCANMSVSEPERAPYTGAVASAWSWSATLTDLVDGVHQITVQNATTADLGSNTYSIDRFLIRVGRASNPVVHPITGNYSTTLLSEENGRLTLNQQAPGADKWRYSLNWGSSWSEWREYAPGKVDLAPQKWSGTKLQEWQGHHVMVQYWNHFLGSSSFLQHGDAKFDTPRRFPHLFANGPFNQFGFDAGLKNTLQHTTDGQWEWHYMDEWPGRVQLNVWGMNPDGKPDQSFVYGDLDGDGVLDRLPPSSLVESVVNITEGPPGPYLAYRFVIRDATLGYELVPQGNRWIQLALFITLWVAPIITGFLAVFVFIGSFYKVKLVENSSSNGALAVFAHPLSHLKKAVTEMKERQRPDSPSSEFGDFAHDSGAIAGTGKRRRVLIATIEYNIDDWNIKVKIGGLGVMAQLMGKSLGHQDLIWVVPCVGGIDYPDLPEERAEPMTVKILGEDYQVEVHYHTVDNITYVLLDSPVFRQQTKAEPYPPRMDNMDSAIYYSTWNQCIAEAVNRFPVDLYHINDYHGGLAPLYLLPNTIPCCLSLHNAEFQGLWPLRTPEEQKEVCEVFNLPLNVVKEYVQFGSVFNLLHAAASYLRVHQSGFGAVGVSKKYGDRSYARYPSKSCLPFSLEPCH
jgi:alpha-1,3-glucan synthase